MKILIADYGAYPFVIELCGQLSKLGHEVTLAYASFFGGPASLSKRSKVPFRTERIEMTPFIKDHFRKRIAHEWKFGRKLQQLLKEEHFDKIILTNIPLISLRPAISLLKKEEREYIIWLQDLLSIAARSILSEKFGVIGKIIGKGFYQIERSALAGADRIICIDESFRDVLSQWQIDLTKTAVLYNWAPLDSFPLLPKVNPFSQSLGIENNFVILYSGTLGMKQNPGILYRLAERLRAYSDILILVITEGIGTNYLTSRLKNNPLTNLRIHPFVSPDALPHALASADLLIAMLNDDAATFCVPSKTWSHLAAGRPQILIMPDHNQAAREVLRAQTGVVVSHQQEDLLIEYILDFYRHRDKLNQMGQKALKYARKFFNIEKKTQDFLHIIEY